jgi:hypothetical protein
MNKLILGIGLLQVIAMSGAHADDAAELHQNIHDMRILMEQSNAQAEYESRKAVIGLYAGGSKNAPGISEMRKTINQSFQQLETRMPCLGAEVNVSDGGQAILICGDNNGRASNDKQENTNETKIVLPPLPTEEVSQ